ncbi:peroxidase 4-like [Prosopis cineraria]|uniref:peroxidase 4-like n=1 Tax=Prosopis cineraria TaxID=364024 RepID=UPI00240F7095|nr:peroxidase 4-like [Prosopis cineraria]
MGASSRSSSCSAIVELAFLLMMMVTGSYSAQLSPNFYSKSCPKVFKSVNSVVHSAISKEHRMGASLLRLFFHDCFVNGCDASVLLDDTGSFKGEKNALPNKNSLRGFEVIDAIKSKVEKECPGIVSCADIVAIAARDSVVLLGGPAWKVKLGRRDSKTASLAAANSGAIPSPFSSLTTLISNFKSHGLSARDMVALSGAHTIGKARCSSFRGRIHNETDIDKSFANARRRTCPAKTGSGDNNVANLDFVTPNYFDNQYFKNLIAKRGLLHSDQVLFNGGATDSLVRAYSKDARAFHAHFVAAMIKMGDIKPLTGSNGQIRRNCRRVN